MKILKALVVVGVCWLGANNSFFIKSNWTGRCLDVKRQDGGKNGNRIILWDCNLNNRTNNNQRWNLIKLNNGFYMIKSNWTGRCLDVKRQDGGKNGNRIILWDCNLNNRTNNNQQWKLVKLANGAYVIKSKWKDRCLDVKYQDGGKNESRIILWDCNLDVNQQWRLVNQ